MALTLVALVTCGAGGSWGQAPEPAGIPWSQVGSIGAATALTVTSLRLDRAAGAPACAPCEPASVPGFDRWVIGLEREGWSLASTGGILALGVAAAAADWRGADGMRRLLATAEAASWAAATAGLVKAVTDRNRPILYTSEATAAAADPSNQRSFPSRHTAIAFAVATSFALHADRSRGARIGMLAGAAGVGAMRLLARRHFPSDVLAGAAVGITSAVVVYEIRF